MKKPIRESTVYATVKLVINLLKESSDAFPPLKSAMGGLSAILSHHDVRPISLNYTAHHPYSSHSKQRHVAKP